MVEFQDKIDLFLVVFQGKNRWFLVVFQGKNGIFWNQGPIKLHPGTRLLLFLVHCELRDDFDEFIVGFLSQRLFFFFAEEHGDHWNLYFKDSDDFVEVFSDDFFEFFMIVDRF